MPLMQAKRLIMQGLLLLHHVHRPGTVPGIGTSNNVISSSPKIIQATFFSSGMLVRSPRSSLDRNEYQV